MRNVSSSVGRSLLLQDSLMHQPPKLQSMLISPETAVGGTLVDLIVILEVFYEQLLFFSVSFLKG